MYKCQNIYIKNQKTTTIYEGLEETKTKVALVDTHKNKILNLSFFERLLLS